MKLTKYLPLFFLLSAYLLFTSSSCETCEAIALADLTIDTFEGELGEISPDGVAIYSFSTKVLNILGIANGCNDEDLNASAGPNGFLEQVVFSENGTFNDAVVLDEMTVELLSLDPGNSASVSDGIQVSMDGSYRLYTTADSRDEVVERREDNNENEARIKSLNAEFKIAGTKNAPMIDEEGNEVYIIRKSLPNVSYNY